VCITKMGGVSGVALAAGSGEWFFGGVGRWFAVGVSASASLGPGQGVLGGVIDSSEEAGRRGDGGRGGGVSLGWRGLCSSIAPLRSELERSPALVVKLWRGARRASRAGSYHASSASEERERDGLRSRLRGFGL
jgi:hypothetical protein